MSYTALVLFRKRNPLSMDDISRTIEQQFFQRFTSNTTFEITAQDRTLEIRWENWAVRIHSVDAHHVLFESQEIAHSFASDHNQASFIASCDARLEVMSESDPGMIYFNTFLFILESLNTLPNVVVFETASGTIL